MSDTPRQPLAHKVIDRAIKAPIEETRELLHKDGELKPGLGKISSVIALSLGFLSLLGVLAFHFPQYLTTPDLRHKYSVDVLRQLLLAALLVSGGMSLANIILGRARQLSMVAFALVIVATALGGSRVPVGNFPDHTPYIGLDWFILDLLGSTLIFVVIEKLFPLYKGQTLFRKEWQTDLKHFAVNHFIVGLALLVVNFLLHHLFGWLVSSDFQQYVQHIPFVPQLLLCILVADLAQYWTHRAYHEVPFLWRFHAVHHSVKTMDWLAGSRQHMLELIFTRVAVLAPLYILGFSEGVMNAYIIVVGFQAVFNHANVHLPWGPLKYLVVTPDFHHWHHASDDEAIDKNYAAHYAFLDYLFGTAVKSPKKFPEHYGVVGDYMPDGFVRQQLFPFRGSTKPRDPAA
ncbi:Sterol desaturase/sphingolipid hydroxylase, fatty acid hydroxylase superfamily [Dyella jiangningensis]|uniref:sterol desaturase family protein n=1 Tax=Dyella sp. AtDHG13 TaxID=1938897 RepID=UPI000891F781|nr:sterol desaturase family protein [Dyella sp. AtDHG13]PXV58678.1 sterol desaturase/sphingolipid hydroxylase (fatty acid hydroxylase superfamily) [Dyella sp. AtDHG13]SDJ86827.1 Sterol desaturase/sphingolipid hydroxylase, fatty acid hydroxylase superfamily [Dyella jiangningensis]